MECEKEYDNERNRVTNCNIRNTVYYLNSFFDKGLKMTLTTIIIPITGIILSSIIIKLGIDILRKNRQ